jgi:hypothetical protein
MALTDDELAAYAAHAATEANAPLSTLVAELQERRAMKTDPVLARLRRHVGHQLRCIRETTGDIGGYVVETVRLDCTDCAEPIIEGTQRLKKVRRDKR